MESFAVQRALRPTRPFACFLIAFGIVLAMPAVAQAHSGTPVIALDYRTTLAPLGDQFAGISASVQDGDRRLRLKVDPRRGVVVLGYALEPFLRFSTSGVEVNERSLTAIGTKLASGGGSVNVNSNAQPRWRLLTSGHTFAWHDHRLAPPIPGDRTKVNWSIPLVVDGRAARIGGEFRRYARPPLWPWLIVAAIILAAAAGIALIWQSLERKAAIAWALLAVPSALLLVTSFALAGIHSRRSDYLQVAAASVLAVTGLAALLLSKNSRVVVAGLLGVIAAVEGLAAAGVFFHSVVISAVPASGARAAAVVALCGGAAAALLSIAEAGHRR
ncbi:MAG: hypothetical protein C5B48_07080 [Candidatus Rokuibacteriota bacterium]|nr:MAG: hypothetical protein C5B48_07080 [Candidatus Rokubacteria bacterium]